MYTPNAESPGFFLKVFEHMEQFVGYRILVGDFNTVLDPEIDRNDIQSKNNIKAAEVLNIYIQETYLCDIWRDRHEEIRQYTYRAKIKNKLVMSRLDYLLLDMAIVSWCDKVEIIRCFRSDHSAILCEIFPHEIKTRNSVFN